MSHPHLESLGGNFGRKGERKKKGEGERGGKGKERQGNKGKLRKMERKRREIVKGGGKLKMEGGKVWKWAEDLLFFVSFWNH